MIRRSRLWPACIALLLVMLLGCAFRQPVRLTSGKAVDVVGLHWQLILMTGHPAKRVYTITYVTKLPIEPEALRPEAEEVWQHFEPTIGQNIDIVVIQPITEPTGFLVKRYRGYNFAHVRASTGWSEPRRAP